MQKLSTLRPTHLHDMNKAKPDKEVMGNRLLTSSTNGFLRIKRRRFVPLKDYEENPMSQLNLVNNFEVSHLTSKLQSKWDRLSFEDANLYHTHPDLFFNRLYALHGITMSEAEPHIHHMKSSILDYGMS